MKAPTKQKLILSLGFVIILIGCVFLNNFFNSAKKEAHKTAKATSPLTTSVQAIPEPLVPSNAIYSNQLHQRYWRLMKVKSKLYKV